MAMLRLCSTSTDFYDDIFLVIWIFGVNKMNSSSSSSVRRASVSLISAFANSAISSPQWPIVVLPLVLLAAGVPRPLLSRFPSSEKRLFLAVNSGSLYAVGCAKCKICLVN